MLGLAARTCRAAGSWPQRAARLCCLARLTSLSVASLTVCVYNLLCTVPHSVSKLVSREHETKFLVRTLVSNLRVGANWRSVIGAMARAVVLHKEGSRVSKARLDAAATAASEAFHVGVSCSKCIQQGSTRYI